MSEKIDKKPLVEGDKPKSPGLFANFVKADRAERRALGVQDVEDDTF